MTRCQPPAQHARDLPDPRRGAGLARLLWRRRRGVSPPRDRRHLGPPGPGDRGPSGGGRDLRLIACETTGELVPLSSPPTEIDPIGRRAGASSMLTADLGARRVGVLLVAVLAAMGLMLGAGATAISSTPISALEPMVEEAGASEETVGSRRSQARRRRLRTSGRRREILRRPFRRRCLRVLPTLPAVGRCTPRRGPPTPLAD